MKKTISHLIIAAPLAVAAFTMTSGAAMAAEPTDIIITDAPDGDDPQPKPQFEGPGDITGPKPCPTHGVDCSPNDDKDGPNNGGGDDSSDDDGDDDGDDDSSDGDDDKDKDKDKVGSIAVPTRIDAGLAPEEEGGMDLSWVIAGSALVTATGAAFAARRGPRSRV